MNNQASKRRRLENEENNKIIKIGTAPEKPMIIIPEDQFVFSVSSHSSSSSSSSTSYTVNGGLNKRSTKPY